MYEKNIQDPQDPQDPRGTHADAPAPLQILTDDALAALHGGDGFSNPPSNWRCC
jgi:hypothetical protein